MTRAILLLVLTLAVAGHFTARLAAAEDVAVATLDNLKFEMETYPTEVLWADPVYLLITLKNTGDFPVSVPSYVGLDVALSLNLTLSSVDDPDVRCRYDSGYGDAIVPQRVVKPGEVFILGWESIAVPPLHDAASAFADRIAPQSKLKLKAEVYLDTHPQVLTLTESLEVRPRPDQEQAWLDRLLKDAKRPYRQRPSTGMPEFPVILYGSSSQFGFLKKIMADKETSVYDVILSREEFLSPGTLRNHVELDRLWNTVQESVMATPPANHRGAVLAYLEKLNRLHQTEAYILADQRRRHTGTLSRILPDERARVSIIALESALDRGMKTGKYTLA